jgi:hypothetical protein
MTVQTPSKQKSCPQSGIVDMIENERGTGPMTWLPLDSDMLTSAAYDADRQVLCAFASARPALCIATSTSRPRSIRPSSMRNPMAASSWRASVVPPATSAWPNFVPPDPATSPQNTSKRPVTLPRCIEHR